MLTVFDNAPSGTPARSRAPEAPRHELEEARIALRCNLKELRLVDSFVASGEFPSRSELMRAALHAFLRSRTLSGTTAPSVDAHGFVEVPIRLRPEECAAAEAFGHTMANKMELRDALAFIYRYGEKKLEVLEHAQRARNLVREAAETRTTVGELTESARDLERKGVVGK